MRISLPPRIIATVTAATIAVTTLGAAPVHADEDHRAARAVATLLGIAVIGSILNDRDDDRKVARQIRRDPPRNSSKAHHNGRPSHKAKPLPRRVSRKLLPQNCLRSFETRNGRARLFTQRCLKRNFAHTNRLPDRCFRAIRTHQGKRKGYSARCLRRAGYSMARR